MSNISLHPPSLLCRRNFNAILNQLQCKIMMILSTRLYWSRITVLIQWPCLFGEFSVEQHELGCWSFFLPWRFLKWLIWKVLQELQMMTLTVLWDITLNVTSQDLEQGWEYQSAIYHIFEVVTKWVIDIFRIFR